MPTDSVLSGAIGCHFAATIVCSEPLSLDGDWMKIPPQQMVVIRGGGQAELLPIPFNDLTRTVVA